MNIEKIRGAIDIAKTLEEKTARQIVLLSQLRRSLWHKCREWLEENPDAAPHLRREALDLIVLGLEDLAREKYLIADLTKHPTVLRTNAEARKLRDDWRAYKKQRDSINVPSIEATLAFSNGEDREGLT